MAVVVRLASLYTAVVFAFGFALGVIRALYLSHLTGAFAAVLIELPVMLVLSWLVAARIFPGRGLTSAQGVEIGLTSFMLLQLAESLLFGVLGPYSLVDNILFYLGDLSPARVAGLAGQLLFAVIPFIQIVRSPT
jgi:hypothetical protein